MSLGRTFSAKTTGVLIYVILAVVLAVSLASAALALQLGFYDMGDLSPREILEAKGYSMDSQYAGAGLLLAEHRMGVLILAVVSALLLIIDYVYLLATAGREPHSREVFPGPLERVPLEVMLAMGAAAAAGLIYMLLRLEDHLSSVFSLYGFYTASSVFLMMLLLVADIASLALVFLTLSYTFAVRLKGGTLGSTSILGWLGKKLWEFIIALPSVWRSVLIILGVALLTLLLMMSYRFVFVILEAAVLAALFIALTVQWQKLIDAAAKMREGDLSYRVDTRGMVPSLRRHGEDLNSISQGLTAAVDEKLRSERLKAELITNVSHDIKTPLTSIVNYVDLLSRAETEEQREEYMEVLSRQSAKLKKLTEDLVEASKAATGSIHMDLAPVNLAELVNQTLGEYQDRLAMSSLVPVYAPPPVPVVVLADGRYLWRVVDNLMSNAVKYALPGTRLYVDIIDGADLAVLCIKNISRLGLNVPAEELTERFVRGDPSRSGSGSGLGLNIAKSLTELMGGRLDLTIDGDLFRVDITLKKAVSE